MPLLAAAAGRRRRRPWCSTVTSTSSPPSPSSSIRGSTGDRLYGRGAYDMKGGARRDDGDRPFAPRRGREVRVGSGSSATRSPRRKGSAAATTWSTAASSATSRSPGSRPTCRSGWRRRGCWPCVSRSAASPAHGATPWLGDNAVLKAHDVFRSIESLPFARQSSELFDRPSINLGRILGGDALNKVPDSMRDRRRHPLPARTGPRDRARAGAGRSPTPRSDPLQQRRRPSSTATIPSSAPCARRPLPTTRASR